MIARTAAILTASLSALLASVAATAAMACERSQPCVYTPASSAYAVTAGAEGDARGSYDARGWSARDEGRSDAGERDAYDEGGAPDRYGARTSSRRIHDQDDHADRYGQRDRRREESGYADRGWGYRYEQSRLEGYDQGGYGRREREMIQHPRFHGEGSGCEVCAEPPTRSFHYQGDGFDIGAQEAPAISESFFYGGVAGGAGPGLEIGGGGFGAGYGGGDSGFGIAQAWGRGMAGAYVSASSSASAYASASAYGYGHAHGGGHSHKSGCGCRH